jgi:hypothetical protein
MPSVRIALAAGLTVTAVALGIVLSRSPLAVAGSNGVPANLAVAHYFTSHTGCQAGGTLPQGTTAIRVSLSANVGPQVNLEALSGEKLVTTGERDAGWGVDETVTVPVRRVAGTVREARICLTTGPVVEPLQINGALARTPSGEVALLRMEYLRPSSVSWLSLVPSVAQRMGLAHAPGGTWVAYMLIILMVGVAGLATRLALRELR